MPSENFSFVPGEGRGRGERRMFCAVHGGAERHVPRDCQRGSPACAGIFPFALSSRNLPFSHEKTKRCNALSSVLPEGGKAMFPPFFPLTRRRRALHSRGIRASSRRGLFPDFPASVNLFSYAGPGFPREEGAGKGFLHGEQHVRRYGKGKFVHAHEGAA